MPPMPPVTVALTEESARAIAARAAAQGVSPEKYLVQLVGDALKWPKGIRLSVNRPGSPEAWRSRGWS